MQENEKNSVVEQQNQSLNQLNNGTIIKIFFHLRIIWNICKSFFFFIKKESLTNSTDIWTNVISQDFLLKESFHVTKRCEQFVSGSLIFYSNNFLK